MSEYQLSQEQKQFFQTFGFLAFPGLLKAEISEIISKFEGVFETAKREHDPSKRTCLVPFIDQDAYLSSLLDHPAINMIAEGLLGADFNYLGSDGNFYTGDTAWHSDGYHDDNGYIKIALYLDPVGPTTGALRVIPGSHALPKNAPARKAVKSKELWGIEQSEVPARALTTEPGDVVVFTHNIMHSSFGGGTRRRMFTLNLGRRCRTEEEVAELVDFIDGGARFWVDRAYGPAMLGTATPARMVHLEQVIANEGHLPELSAKARLEMAEPARG